MARNLRAPFGACLACAAGLVLLVLLAYGVDLAQRLDATVLARFLVAPGSHAEALATGISRLADPPALLLMLAAACTVGLVRGRPQSAAAALAVVAGANLTTQMLKVALAHPRFQPVLGADQLSWSSFPSGHVTAAASIAIAALFVVPRGARPPIALLGACLVAVVSWSVLALAWHFPSDALGGVIVAAGWGFAVLAALLVAEGAPLRQRAGQSGRRAAISLK